MKTDTEVRILQRERQKGVAQEVAAARAGMSVRTARKYEHLGQLPSQLKQPRTYRTRPNPFAEDWAWVVTELERDPALHATTVVALLCERRPDHYQPVQLRALQRHIAAWRAQHGPDKEVIFEQIHIPGRLAQSDFTDLTDLNITLGGLPFSHLVFHLVLTYSNVEAVTICFSESFEALAEGIETCLWQIGGVPERHRTDNLTAAVRSLSTDGRKDFTERYAALMAHYGMQATSNTPGEPKQNGDVEQAHYRFKDAVDQALRVRGSRDFGDRAAYLRFLHDLIRRRNQTRAARWERERAALRPLPRTALHPSRELRVTVSRFSTIRVLQNTYSVPSRLIGVTLMVRLQAETLELYVGTTHTLTLPRLSGQQRHLINYRHIIWSLVRKPGAFAQYRYRDELFPRVVFRRAYDALQVHRPAHADRDYLRLLHLAASTSEADVEAALSLLLESGRVPSFDVVRDLVRQPETTPVPALIAPVIDLRSYDQLLASRCRHD
jgi:hypothetical protein